MADNIRNIGQETRFSSTNQPLNSGRKRNVFKDTQKNYEISLDDMRQMLTDLLSLNIEGLKAVVQDDNSPVFKIVIATAIKNCIKSGNWTQVNYMVDRLFGKSQENVIEFKNNLPINITVKGYENKE